VPLLLDAVPNGAGEPSRLHAVERAHWAASGSARIERGRTLIHPFSTGAGRVREIHLLLIAFSERCAVQVDVIRGGAGVSTTPDTAARVAGGVMPCRGRTVTGYRSVVLDQPPAPKTDYLLHVTATPNEPPPDGIRHGPIAGGGWAPFRFDNDATNSTDALTIRLISERWP
jgi:hypothetical protein